MRYLVKLFARILFDTSENPKDFLYISFPFEKIEKLPIPLLLLSRRLNKLSIFEVSNVCALIEPKQIRNMKMYFDIILNLYINYSINDIDLNYTQRFMYMESCVFECEDFPKENRMQANKATHIG